MNVTIFIIIMTVVTGLTLQIREILDVFIKNEFDPLTLKQIGDELKIDTNTINQRILRDKTHIFTSDGKPKKIQLKKDVHEIVFYRYKNTCVRCNTEFHESFLTVQPINPNIPDPDHYTNLVLICNSCLENLTDVKSSQPINITEFGKKSLGGDKWDYKTVQIRLESHYEPNTLHRSYSYYGFREDGNVNEKEMEKKWMHLVTKNENGEEQISSMAVSDILNAFGRASWELINLYKTREIQLPGASYHDNQNEMFEALFKRRSK